MYKQRAVDQILAELLKGMGAVLIEGPRGCGKTSTGLHHSRSSIRLDRSPELIQLAELNPTALLEGETPRLVDEWQLAPSLWNAMRHEIDDRQQRGQFILSGSAQPASDVTRHSGAGRFGRLRMRPMALAESEASSSDISLSALKGASTVSARSPLSYQALAEQAVRGDRQCCSIARIATTCVTQISPPPSAFAMTRLECAGYCSRSHGMSLPKRQRRVFDETCREPTHH